MKFPSKTRTITGYLAGALGIILVLSVCWNIVAPSDYCWLGFWKGIGTLWIGVMLCALSVFILE